MAVCKKYDSFYHACEKKDTPLLEHDPESVAPIMKSNTMVTNDPTYKAVWQTMPKPVEPRVATAVEALSGNIMEAHIRATEADLPGGRQAVVHSDTKRNITLVSEAGDEMTISVETNTRVSQVRALISTWSRCSSPDDLIFVGKTGINWRKQLDTEEARSVIQVKGLKSFTREYQQYEHPILVLGCGFGGIVTAMKLLHRGRKNFQMVDKMPDFGGFSWFGIANKTTKLQTEAGTYNLNYFFHDHPVPEDMPTWPTRDYLLMMFSRTARWYGLEEYASFNTHVLKITPKGKSKEHLGSDWVQVLHEPADGSGEAEMVQASAAVCYPGNLSTHKIAEYQGEDDFDGYIEYASANMPDFQQCAGRDTVIVGHGAFAIENVRTCLEFDAGKIYVVCRRRNIAAPKAISWMVTLMEAPVPGPVMLDMFKVAYDLIAWDPWSCYSVTTNDKRSFARIDQGTMFGVTDVYFAAGYYGLMEVVIGGVKRLSRHCMHLNTNKKVDCQAILKTVGVRADYHVDKMLGLKELVGFWVNGNPLITCMNNSLFVQAQNFAGFSIAPGLDPQCEQVLWLVDYPQDWALIKDALPRHNKSNNNIQGNALFVYPTVFAMQTSLVLSSGLLPGFMIATMIGGALKSKKQNMSHPMDMFLEECEQEWEMYCDMCEAHPKADKSKPRPAFPFQKDVVLHYMKRAQAGM